ncbi:MAG: hypothetical protein DYG89_48075 [Caldilinea sp. CFX5]|nr:hypothetical protein [Caldilinea sp. CFX5]
MNKEDFRKLLCRILEEACQEIESRLGRTISRKFVVVLHGAGHSNFVTTLDNAIDMLYLDRDQFYRIIDIAITGIAPNATRIFMRASTHLPSTFDKTWNTPVGQGPFKILFSDKVEVLDNL